MSSGEGFRLFGLCPEIFERLGGTPLFLKSLFVCIEVVGGDLAICCVEMVDKLMESEVRVSVVWVFKDLVVCMLDQRLPLVSLSRLCRC